MSRTEFKYVRIKADETKYGKGSFNSLAKQDFARFNPSLLGLGDVSAEGRYVQALAAFCDLEGFTSFCNQVDSHLVIPVFLTDYLQWLFKTLAEEFREGETADRVTVWGSLPFLSKFLGDGILFIRDTSLSGGQPGIRNIVKRLNSLGVRYHTEFVPAVRKKASKVPCKLRCGIARGQIISVGDGDDFVGSCINVASRLQKLAGLSFAVSVRGIELPESLKRHAPWNDFIVKRVELRGIGDEELVYVKRSEFVRLASKDQKHFSEP